MKKYDSPSIDIIKLGLSDIVTTSVGTETPVEEEEDAIWEIEIY